MSTFSGAAEGKAIGTWTAWTGVAFVAGPLLGGFLVDSASWRLIFAINVVPIALTLYLLRRVKITKDEKKQAKVDVVGAALCALGLGGPVFALIEQPRYGWADPLIYLPLGVGVITFIAFLIYESRARQPMLKLDLFKNWNFLVGNVATLAVYAGLSVSTFLIVLFLQQVSHYSALKAGLAMLPVTIIMFLLSPRAGALSSKYGPRLFMGLGPLIAGVGFLLVARLPFDFNYWTGLLPGIVIFGLGLSITVAPLTAAILGDVPQSEAGIASAINNAVARVAGLVAVAAVGAIVALQFGNTLDRLCSTAPAAALAQAKQASLVTTPPKPYQHDVSFKIALQEASVSAFHAGMNVTAGLVIAGGVISLAGIRNPAKVKNS
jgi:MFS family permease